MHKLKLKMKILLNKELSSTVTENLIHVMLASLGYYPSYKEIFNIQNEVMHMKLIEGTKDKNDDINFKNFFLNIFNS